MAVDPTPAYGPTRSFPSSAITDSTAFGRSILTAADATAARALLSIADVGDLRNYAISRAQTLLGLTNPTVVVDEPFEITPGGGTTPNSWFSGSSGAGSTVMRTDRNGGWATIQTSTTASRDRNVHNAQIATGPTGCLVSNVGTQKWYQLWLFSIDTTVDSACFLEMGWINTAFSVNQPKIGVLGSGSTTKFRAFDNSTGVDSTISVDTGIHIGEHWSDGTTTIRMSIDGETAVSYTTAKTSAVMPIAQVANGATAANRALSLGHCIIITPQS